MLTYIICGVVSLPIYLLYNIICYKKKKVSIWINNCFSEKQIEVLDDKYYKLQLNSSIKTCLLLTMIIIIGIVCKWEEMFFLVFLIAFHFSIFITKCLALKKRYLIIN